MEEINKERWSRSVALEDDYVHQVYEKIGRDLKHAKDPLRNTVQNFLNGLEPGSIIADIGNGDYLSEGMFSVSADRSTALHLPLRSEAFDAALCVGVLHHLASRERRVQALRETTRVLRVGGRVLIAVRSHQCSQDILMPWYGVKKKKKGKRCSDEDRGEFDLDASDCDSLSLPDDDEPSTPSMVRQADHTEPLRPTPFRDFLHNVFRRFSADESQTTLAPNDESYSPLGLDADSLPKNLQALIRDNCIELRNLDEAVPKEPRPVEQERRRSLTDVFKNLWTSRSDLSTAIRTPLKRSVTTATCNYSPSPLESIREFEMTLGEADQIVNAFLESSSVHDIHLELSRFQESRVLDSSCANKSDEEESQCHKSPLHSPPEPHSDYTNTEQELSDTISDSKESEDKPSERLKGGLVKNELLDTSAKNFILPSSKIKSYFPDISQIDLSIESNSKIISEVCDNEVRKESRGEVEISSFELSGLLGESNERLESSKYNLLADSYESGLRDCSLNHEDKVSLSMQQRLLFVRKQMQNSDRHFKFRKLPKGYKLGRRISESVNFNEKIEIEPENLARSITFYSMPNLNDSSRLQKISFVFDSIPEKKNENENMSYLKKRMLESLSEKYPQILDSYKSELPVSNNINFQNFQLNRSLTDFHLKNVSPKSGFRKRCENNNNFQLFLSPKQLPTGSSQSINMRPLKLTPTSDGLSKSFERLNIPLDKKAVPKHNFANCISSNFKKHIDDEETMFFEQSESHIEDSAYDNKLVNLNDEKSLKHCSEYMVDTNLSSASVQFNCPNKTHFSGRLPVERDSVNNALTTCDPNDVDEDIDFETMTEERIASDLNLSSHEISNSPGHMSEGKCSDTSYPSEDLFNRNSFLKYDSRQNVNSSMEVTKCISERNSERFRSNNELTETEKGRTNENVQEENQSSLVVNYSFGRIQDNGATVVMHRYYHLFEEDELLSLIEKYVSDLHILEYFEYQSHWCVIAEKVRVWTI